MLAGELTPGWMRERRYLRKTRLPPQRPAQAAADFVEFMQEFGRTGDVPWSDWTERGAKRLGVWSWYLTYCDCAAGCHPVPDNLFAKALGEIAPWRQVSDYSSGKRRRLTVYSIPEPREAGDGALPVPEAEPLRMAA